MTILRSRGIEKTKTEWNREKREKKKDWTKKKIKQITEAFQKITDNEFDVLEESLRFTLKSLRE